MHFVPLTKSTDVTFSHVMNDQHDTTKRPQGVENTANATQQTRRGQRVQRAARTRYACYFFISYPILIILLAYHHNPRKQAVALIFRRITSPWQPPPSTTPENEPLCSFSGGMTSRW